MKTCATVTTVAAVAVVGVATVAPAPSVTLNNLLVESTYIEYELSVEELSANNDYSIVISTTNQEDLEFPVTEDGTYQNKVEGLTPEWEYNLSFISYDEYLGETVLLKQTFQTKKESPSTPPSEPPTEPPVEPPPEEPTLPEYQVTINDITIEGINEVDIHFDTDKLDENCVVELLITYRDGKEEVVGLNEEDLMNKRVRVEVNGDVNISVTPILLINDGEERIEFTKYEHTFTKNLDAETFVKVTQSAIVFYYKALLNGATHAQIIDETTGEAVYNERLWGNNVTYYYQVGNNTQPTYTLYLTDESGQKVSNGHSITFDANYSSNAQYVFNYKNPSDVGITYNNDGTINVYIQTDFSCDDADVFYQVVLGDLRFRSTEPTFSVIGIPNETYSLTYDVCVEVDGIIYSIKNAAPSGTVNEYSLSNVVSTYMEETSIDLEIYGYQAEIVDFSSARIVTSNGQVFNILESDWTFSADNDVYTCSVQIPDGYEYFDIYVTMSPSKNNMANFTEYKGSLQTEFTQRIYK